MDRDISEKLSFLRIMKRVDAVILLEIDLPNYSPSSHLLFVAALIASAVMIYSEIEEQYSYSSNYV